MEKLNSSFESNFINLYSETDIELLCENSLQCLKINDSKGLITNSKALLKSLLLISSHILASKAFLTLLSISEYFHSQGDSKNTYKYLSGANLLIYYIKDPESLLRFSSIKSKIFTKLSPVNYFSADNKKPVAPRQDLSVLVSDFSEVHNINSSLVPEKKPMKKLNRPSSGRRYLKSRPLSSTTLPTSVKKNNNLAKFYASRPSSAKKGKTSIMDFGEIYRNPSYFKLLDRDTEVLVNKHSSRDLAQNVEVLTPPRTPEGLVKIVLVDEMNYNTKEKKHQVKIFLENKEEKIKLRKEGERTKEEKIRKQSIETIKMIRERKVNDKKKETKVWAVKKDLDKKSKTEQQGKGYLTNLLNGRKKHFESGTNRNRKNKDPDKIIKPVVIHQEVSTIAEKIRKCVTIKIQITEIYLKKIIMIQSVFRGHLARERFLLMKFRKPVIRNCAGIVDFETLHIRIQKSSDIYIIKASNSLISYKQTLKSFDNTSFSIKNLSINSGQLIYSPIKRESSLKFIHCLKLETIFNKQKVSVCYSQNLKNKQLKAEIFLSDTNYELIIPTPPNKDLIFYITHEVNNYLILKENKLEISYPKTCIQKSLLYSVFCKQSNEYLHINIYRINTLDSVEIEVCTLNLSSYIQKLHFFKESIFNVLLKDSMFSYNSSLVYFLSLDLKSSASLYSKLNFRYIGSIKKQISSKEYLIRCFCTYSNKGKYLFECIGSDSGLIASVQLSEKEIKKFLIFEPKQIEPGIERLLTYFTIIKDRLVPIQQEKLSTKKLVQSMINIKVIRKIQIKFKARFMRNKENLESTNNIILFKLGKSINGVIYEFTIYKLESGLLIECLNSISKELSFKYLEKPLDYISALNKISDLRRLVDATKVVNGKLVLTRAKINIYSEDPENSIYFDTPFEDVESYDEGWPVLLKKELGGVWYILKGNVDENKDLIIKLMPLDKDGHSLWRKFGKEDIVKHVGIYDPKALIPSLRVSNGSIVTSDLVRYSVPALAEELLGIHVICKIGVKIKANMYLICASLSEDLENYENSELRFYARLNSSLERCRKTTISIAQASQATGIDSKSIFILSEYICKNMIVITNDEFYIDCSKPPMAVEKIVIKLQALIRGYRTRLAYFVKILCIFKEHVKIQTNSFTILVYILNSAHYLAAVNGIHVFKSKLSEKFMDNFYKSANKKVFVFEEVSKNLKNSDKRFTFLQNANIRDYIKRRPTIELAKASVVPNLVTFLRSSTIKRNENSTLLHTFEITPNFITYTTRIFQNDLRTYVEVSGAESFISKDIKTDVKDFENFVKFIHVDLVKQKIIFKDRTLLNRTIMIDGHKVSVIVFENKNGVYLDGFIIDTQKMSFIYLGENAKVNSVMTRLRIQSEKLVLRD